MAKNMLAVLAKARQASNTPVPQPFTFDDYIVWWGRHAGVHAISKENLLLTDRDVVIRVVNFMGHTCPQPETQTWCENVLQALKEEEP